MGVYYKAVSGYGIVLDINQYDFKELSHKVGFEYDDDYFDDYDFVEYLCKQFDLNYSPAGNAYNDGGVIWLIGDTRSIDTYGLVELRPLTDIDDTCRPKVEELVKALDVDLKIGYYSGLYVF
jgi:hypothetical protein